MTDTSYIKREVEPWVRSWLAKRFPGHSFGGRKLILGNIVQDNPGEHEFDAVSEDNSIVAAIKGHSWKTRGGNLPAAKYASLYQELYFLSLVQADKRLLILTNKEMYQDFKLRSRGKIADGIELIFCELPESMSQQLEDIRDKASRETSR